MVDLFRRACFCRSEYGSFGFHLCFDAAMGFPGDGTFALTSKLKAKETARFKAEAEAEEEREKKRKAGESVAAESSPSTCVQQELAHAGPLRPVSSRCVRARLTSLECEALTAS